MARSRIGLLSDVVATQQGIIPVNRRASFASLQSKRRMFAAADLHFFCPCTIERQLLLYSDLKTVNLIAGLLQIHLFTLNRKLNKRTAKSSSASDNIEQPKWVANSLRIAHNILTNSVKSLTCVLSTYISFFLFVAFIQNVLTIGLNRVPNFAEYRVFQAVFAKCKFFNCINFMNN